ncbi:MAG: hypothetical protein SGPRY_007097 [Prymnesium sp.]
MARIIRSSKTRARCETTRYCQRPGTQMGVELAGARSAAASSTWSKGEPEDDDAAPASTSDSSVLLYTRTETFLEDRHLYFFTQSYLANLPTSARSLPLNEPLTNRAHNLRDVLVLHGGEEGGMIPGVVGLSAASMIRRCSTSTATADLPRLPLDCEALCTEGQCSVSASIRTTRQRGSAN